MRLHGARLRRDGAGNKPIELAIGDAPGPAASRIFSGAIDPASEAARNARRENGPGKTYRHNISAMQAKSAQVMVFPQQKWRNKHCGFGVISLLFSGSEWREIAGSLIRNYGDSLGLCTRERFGDRQDR
jgi:hypothetical protein